MRHSAAKLTDEALLALVSRGDEQALAALHDRLAGAAFSLALRVLRDRSHAEDAVQDAFLALWRNASRFTPSRGKASTWVLTLVHRRAVDLVRREARRPAEPLDRRNELDEAADGAVWARLEGQRIRSALHRLPPRQREVIELAYYGGLTQNELATRLGEPVGTIKSRTHAVLASLSAARRHKASFC